MRASVSSASASQAVALSAWLPSTPIERPRAPRRGPAAPPPEQAPLGLGDLAPQRLDLLARGSHRLAQPLALGLGLGDALGGALGQPLLARLQRLADIAFVLGGARLGPGQGVGVGHLARHQPCQLARGGLHRGIGLAQLLLEDAQRLAVDRALERPEKAAARRGGELALQALGLGGHRLRRPTPDCLDEANEHLDPPMEVSERS
jgi:hypothetical protein